LKTKIYVAVEGPISGYCKGKLITVYYVSHTEVHFVTKMQIHIFKTWWYVLLLLYRKVLKSSSRYLSVS